MKAQKHEWSSGPEDAGHYRRKAEEADRAAETAETAEAKQFYQEVAKNYYLMADSAGSGPVAESDGSGPAEVEPGPEQTIRLSPVKPKSRWFSFFGLWGSTPRIRK
jgi:hypothetical protein